MAAPIALLLVAAPIPWGSVGPAATLAARLACLAALLLALRPPGLSRALARVVWPLAALVGVAGIGLVQSLPWPRWIVMGLSPVHLRLVEAGGRDALPGWTAGWAELSLAPEVSRSAALTWAAAAAVLTAAAVAGVSRRARRLLLAALLAGGAIQAWTGVADLAAERTYRLAGTFVGPAHVGLYLNLCLCASAAAVWAVWRRLRRGWDPGRAVLWLVVFGLALAGSVAALVLTGSRGALLAAAAALTVQGIVVLIFSRYRRWWWLVALPVAAAVVLTLDTAIFNRLLSTVRPSFDVGGVVGRLEVWSLSLALVSRFPLLGSGLGTFLEAFTLVQPPEMADVRWVRAHNDLLELLVTGGVAAAALVAAGVVASAARLVSGFRHGRSSESRAACLAGLGWLAAIAVAECFDFALTLPANGLAAAALLGAALGVPFSERRRRSAPPAAAKAAPRRA